MGLSHRKKGINEMPTDELRVRKSIEVDKDLDTFIKKHYGDRSMWFIVNALLRAFVNLHDKEVPENKLNSAFKEAAIVAKEEQEK